ncbi:MAG: phosphoribosylaminoimidazolesuccinocarboxamide synthase [Dehalococcoidales bacterium]|jgi:phosphoribosylaminoimidazole-succinocarboxamide synthase
MDQRKGILLKSELDLPPFINGKVRDTYNLGEHLLIVATDRISAFDVVLPVGIPTKGKVLNQLSAVWFEKTGHIVQNHLVEVVTGKTDLNKYLLNNRKKAFPAYLAGRSMVVKKTQRLSVECVVRGYLAGSGWAEYKKQGTVCGIKLPAGLVESQELPEPIFTPTTKANAGHDMPMTIAEARNMFGSELAEKLKATCLSIYSYARDYAKTRGFIIADTKMEFGLENGKLILIDELLTPDSSRFWDIERYEPGRPQDSFDKQPLRDWLEKAGWNKEPPAPMLPEDVIASTAKRYETAFERLTGKKLR